MRRSFFSLLSILTAIFCGTLAASAEGCKLSAAEVYAQASPSIVRIFVFSIDPFDPYQKTRYAIGTGFIVDKEGTILTNYHVLLNAARINLGYQNGESFAGEFIAGDPVLDVALIRPMEAFQDYTPLDLGADTGLAPGSEVFAIGNPLGFKMAVSWGVVSSTDVVLPVSTMSWDAPFIQTDAAINPGNSGGPLIDQCGKVVGMNTLVLPYAENMGFAIPARTLRKAVEELLKNGRIIRPWIGISGRMADEFVMSLAQAPFTEGFMIETVEPGSAAAEAGLLGGTLPLRLATQSYLIGGDIIKSVNGRSITDLSTTAAVVRSLKPGDKIKVEYFRDGEILSLETTLPERPVLQDDIRVLYRSIYGDMKQDGT